MRAAAASAATAGIRRPLSGVSPRTAVNRSLLLANAMTADVPAVRLVTHESWKDHPALRLAMLGPYVGGSKVFQNNDPWSSWAIRAPTIRASRTRRSVVEVAPRSVPRRSGS